MKKLKTKIPRPITPAEERWVPPLPGEMSQRCGGTRMIPCPTYNEHSICDGCEDAGDPERGCYPCPGCPDCDDWPCPDCQPREGQDSSRG